MQIHSINLPWLQEQIGVTVEREGETGRVYGENAAGEGDGE